MDDVRDSVPIAPMSSSLVWVVLAVAPDVGAVLLPVPVCVTSTLDAEIKPLA